MVSVQALKAQGGKVEVLSLDKLSYMKINGERVRVLVGNVAFRKDNVVFTCDSAIQFIDQERIRAFSNVKFNQGDTLILTGDELDFDDERDMALVKGKEVRMTDGKMRLRTTALHYDMANQLAYYTDSAHITDGDNVLTSIKGYYYAATKDMYFKKRVRLTNPDHRIATDTLRYNVGTENSYFKGPSHIHTADGQYLYCENGTFYGRGNEVRLGRNSRLIDGSQELVGDSLYFNNTTGMGLALKRARLTDTAQGLVVEGNRAVYNRDEDWYLITDSLLMLQYNEQGDSVYLSSDTLRLIYDTAHKQRVALAYHHVRFYEHAYQGVCDSMVYCQADSSVSYHGHPVVWLDSFQITCDFILGHTDGHGLKQVALQGAALMGQRLALGLYDQISGDSMTAYFDKGELRRVQVHDKAKAIYHVMDGDTALVGANEVGAASAQILFGAKGIRKLSFVGQGEALVTPAKDVDPSAMRLSGFEWKGRLRPRQPSHVFWLPSMAIPVD
jgi:hypothetical protein